MQQHVSTAGASIAAGPGVALADARFIDLVTFRRTGVPVGTPVLFAQDGSRLLVRTAADAGKLKRIAHTPDVEVTPADSKGRHVGATVTGNDGWNGTAPGRGERTGRHARSENCRATSACAAEGAVSYAARSPSRAPYSRAPGSRRPARSPSARSHRPTSGSANAARCPSQNPTRYASRRPAVRTSVSDAQRPAA